jgi:pimeloyl-ACP methyl ester carboxylesterase
LILIGTASTGNNEVLSGFYDEDISQLSDPVSRDFVHEFQAGTCVNTLGDGMSLDTIIDESMQLSARTWQQALRGLMDYRSADAEPDLSAINCPTLILWGSGDEIFPRAEQDKLLRLMGDVQMKSSLVPATACIGRNLRNVLRVW